MSTPHPEHTSFIHIEGAEQNGSVDSRRAATLANLALQTTALILENRVFQRQQPGTADGPHAGNKTTHADGPGEGRLADLGRRGQLVYMRMPLQLLAASSC